MGIQRVVHCLSGCTCVLHALHSLEVFLQRAVHTFMRVHQPDFVRDERFDDRDRLFYVSFYNYPRLDG